jgi:hypothetical protein
MDLVLKENLTALPLISSHLNLTNSTSLTQPFVTSLDKSIQSKVATAQLSNFDFTVHTTKVGGIWTMEENYSLTVSGANTNSGSNVRANLAFIVLNVSQSLQIGSVELDAVGATYLLPALQAKAANYTNLAFNIDGSATRNAVIPSETTQRFWLLDFTWVTPISTWAKVSGTLDQSSQWTLTPAFPRYNLTLGIPSPEGTLLTSWVAIYSPSLSITAPPYAWIDGSNISFDTPTPAESVTPIIILALIVLLVATLLLNRKITKPLRRFRKR